MLKTSVHISLLFIIHCTASALLTDLEIMKEFEDNQKCNSETVFKLYISLQNKHNFNFLRWNDFTVNKDLA